MKSNFSCVKKWSFCPLCRPKITKNPRSCEVARSLLITKSISYTDFSAKKVHFFLILVQFSVNLSNFGANFLRNFKYSRPKMPKNVIFWASKLVIREKLYWQQNVSRILWVKKWAFWERKFLKMCEKIGAKIRKNCTKKKNIDFFGQKICIKYGFCNE